MARALRLQFPGGRYHVTARGNERREIFYDDRDRFGFLELLGELGPRFGTRVHAYVAAPSAELVAERLKALRAYRWSSYPGYAGYREPLGWVWREPLARLCGGNTDEERRAGLREYTEARARQGVWEPPWERLVDGVVLGTIAFAQSLHQQACGNPREQKALRASAPTASWEQIVAALEQVKGEDWASFADRHGDWGRDAALWLGRCAGRMRLAQLGALVGNLDYAVVSKAIARFEQGMATDPHVRDQITRVQLQLSK